jgi:hypothetical protein
MYGQKSHKLDLPPSADEMGRGRTYPIRPVTHSWYQPLHTEQNLDNVYKLVISQIISERWDIWSIKENLKIPLKTSGFKLSLQEVNKNHQMKPQNTKSYPTNGTLI